MNFKFLNGKSYKVNPHKFLIDWDESSVSKYQTQVKAFFKKYWKDNLCCEEFPCRPLSDKNLRFDLINLDRRIVVEAQHTQHAQFSPKFHKSSIDFDRQLMHDRLKELWCFKNDFKFIEIFPHHLPIKLHELVSKYGRIH